MDEAGWAAPCKKFPRISLAVVGDGSSATLFSPWPEHAAGAFPADVAEFARPGGQA